MYAFTSMSNNWKDIVKDNLENLSRLELIEVDEKLPRTK